MRILVVGINYARDLIGVAKYNTELCEALVSFGHEVRVVTAPPTIQNGASRELITAGAIISKRSMVSPLRVRRSTFR